MAWRTRLSVLVFAGVLAACATSTSEMRTAPVQVAHLAPDAFHTADAERLPLRAYARGPGPKAIVVALHGFNDYSRFIDEAARHFVASGIYTVAYDQRGFGATRRRGEWPGIETLAGDLREFLRLVRQDYPAVPLFVLGESMGGAVAAVALVDAPPKLVDGVILSAPAVWSRDSMPWYQRAGLWILSRLAPTMTLSGKGLRIEPSDNLAMRIELSRDPLVIKETRVDALVGVTDLMDRAVLTLPRMPQRVLYLYGERDEVIPPTPVRRLLEGWPEATRGSFRFSLYPRGYHMLFRDLQRHVVWADVVTWMLDGERALPSGMERRREDIVRELSGLADRSFDGRQSQVLR